MSDLSISIIVPVLNEAANLGAVLRDLPASVETIVVDGGSDDTSVAVAQRYAGRVITTERGRAIQMNAGALAASGELLVFLHADSGLPRNFRRDLERFDLSDRVWGRFDVRLDGRGLMFRMIEWMMNVRSRLTGICTGDQAMFVRRDVFEQVGGFSAIPLMEDIDLSRRLKRVSRPYCIRPRVLTSARRWHDNGIIPTILLMWRLRLKYFLGTSPEKLHYEYYVD